MSLLMSISITAAIIVWLMYQLAVRLRLSQAKHPSLRGHVKMSRRVAKWVPYFSYHLKKFYACDGANKDVVAKRRQGMAELVKRIEGQNSISQHYAQSLADHISDVNFVGAYKVPFPFKEQLPQALKIVPIAEQAQDVLLKDLDGNWRYDVAGSYGLNIFGYDFYKHCMNAGHEAAAKLGPVLGPYHPLIRTNVERLKAVSGLDEVSFHMSGTEAVMQAVRLARYHTGKTHLVRLCGAYHGWWDGVQVGIGNGRKTDDAYTLADLSEKTLHVLATRNDIACVLINPMQAMHPNADAPGDGTLIASERKVNFDRENYTHWLQRIRQVCDEKNIVLIFDEVFTGFRLAHRGAQEYFKVQADIVTYGKSVGGGFPVGVVCGRKALMKRYRDKAPADISFARGTFNSHPYLLGAMDGFLTEVAKPEFQRVYQQADEQWNTRVAKFNQLLSDRNLPIQIANMHSVLTVLYTKPGRFNWMLQFYLRAEGIELSWTGTGRMIMCLNYSDDDFEQLIYRFTTAVQTMNEDGWWDCVGLTNKKIKHQFTQDMLRAKLCSLSKYAPKIIDSPSISSPKKVF